MASGVPKFKKKIPATAVRVCDTVNTLILHTTAVVVGERVEEGNILWQTRKRHGLLRARK